MKIITSLISSFFVVILLMFFEIGANGHSYRSLNDGFLLHGTNEIKFTKSQQTLGDTRSFGIDVNDVDMDGDKDVFLTNYLGYCKLWINNGQGSFTQSNQNFGNSESHDVAIQDLNGDSYPDIFLLNHAAPCKIFFNNGKGVFTNSGQNIGSSTDYPGMIVLGDVDNDGDPDAFISYYTLPNRLWINDGTGKFTITKTEYGGSSGHNMELADIDGNGTLDIYICFTQQPDAIWINDGKGNFHDSNQRLGDSSGVKSVDSGDIDGDGDLDFVISNSVHGIKVWLNQNNTGTYIEAGSYFGTGSGKCKLFEADHDGDLDLITSHNDNGNFLWINDGHDKFTSAGAIFGNKRVACIGFGDLDGDNDIDVVIGQAEGTGGNSIYFNETTIDSNENAYLNQTPPDSTPVRFPPDSLLANSQWFWHGSPSFSPDLTEMYWIKYLKASNRTEIACMKFVNNKWTTPFRPSFANATYRENNPILSLNGDTLYFLSSRPGGPFFRTIRQNDTLWSQPVSVSVPKPANLNFGLQFSIAKNRTIYFELEGQNGLDIYRSKLVNGAYSQHEKLGNGINSNGNDFTPWIHPDEKYLIFASDRTGGYGDFDLYISFQNNDGSWTQPQNLKQPINSSGTEVWPHLSPDNKYLFFVSERAGDSGYNPYWITTSTIEKLHPVTGVKDGMGSLPTQIKLYHNYPNPFNPTTTIRYDVKENAKLKLAIYDQLGRLIKTLVDDMKVPGNYAVTWDGTDTMGQQVSSGFYFYRLASGAFSQTLKAIVLK
jgi:hypothetical protein